MITRRWFTQKSMFSILKDGVGILGVFSIIVAIVDFFPQLKFLSVFFKQSLFLILLILVSFICVVIKNIPKKHFLFKINNRDTWIELRIGNMEKISATYVVPVNSEFDIDLKGSTLASTSVLSMIVKKYFAGDCKTLQKKISVQLKSKDYVIQKENGKYKLGTTVRIETDDKLRAFYFVANSQKVGDRRVESDENGLYATLNGLWSYVSINGVKEHIVVPLLCSGNGRIKITREEVYKEIVRSFVASCAGRNYCNKMTVVVRGEDIDKYKINVEKLVEFTQLQTEYVDFVK